MKIIYDKEDLKRHREYGSQGGKKSAAGFSKEERQERARRAIAARWAKKKEKVTQ